MPSQADRPRSEFHLIQLLPNILTIAAICAGLTAIRFGLDGNYVQAVQLILVACVLDGLDGRLARLLKVDSKMGAELDSLADFLNFGISPALVLYFWSLQDMRGIGWICVLIFAVCCVLRLARFNVTAKSEETEHDGSYFTGVPAPAGAMLVLLPMFVSFTFTKAPHISPYIVCFFLVFVGFLLISNIPTWSFKTTKISRENVRYFLVGFVFVTAAVLTYAWVTLVVLCMTYIGFVVWAWISRAPTKINKGA